jgi:hypothetical protein
VERQLALVPALTWTHTPWFTHPDNQQKANSYQQKAKLLQSPDRPSTTRNRPVVKRKNHLTC